MNGQYFLWIVVGNAGMGKSTLINKVVKLRKKVLYILDMLIQNDLSKVKILDVSTIKGTKELSKFKGKRVVEYENCPKQFYYKIWHLVRDTVLVFEDAGAVVPRNAFNDKSYKSILLKYRHMRCDVVFAGHTISDIPQQVYRTAKYITIFPVAQNYNGQYKLSSDALVMQAEREVNKEYQKVYSKSPDKAYGIYATIDIRANKIVYRSWK